MNTKGFTLIEVVLYIAMLSIIMAGSLSIAYGILDSAKRTKEKVAVNQEIIFVVKKVEWLLNDIDRVADPLSGTSTSVTFHKRHFPDNPFTLDTDSASGTLRVMRNGGEVTVLSGQEVLVQNFVTRIVAGEGPTKTLFVSFDINGRPYRFNSIVWP